MSRQIWLIAFVLPTLLACGSQVAPVTSPPPAAPETAPQTEPEAVHEVPNTAVTIGERKSIQSEIMGEERKYIVGLPPGYEVGSQSYPVIYLLDGDAHFHHATGIVAFLSAQTRMPRAIVVGISNTDRTRDLTPTNEPRAPTSGGADRFLDFIEKELVAQIDSDYRTAGLKILVGHSLGGLFAVHSMIARPALFHAHIAASPSLQWDSELMAKRLEPMLDEPFSGFLYYSLGTEPEGITTGNRRFAELLAKKAPKTLQWSYDFMSAEDHGSVVHHTIYRGLEQFFVGWRLPKDTATAADLTAHYQSVSEQFRVDSKPPEGIVNALGYRQLLGKPANMAAAKELFELNVELYPGSANVYDSLGEAHERAGELETALANYEKAVATSRPGERFHDAFITNRDRVAETLAKRKGEDQ